MRRTAIEPGRVGTMRRHRGRLALVARLGAATLVASAVLLGYGPAAVAEDDPPVTAPSNFRADIDFSRTIIEWDPSTSDAGILYYSLRLKEGFNTQYFWSVEPTMTFYLNAGRTYELHVQATDEQYNRSEWAVFEFTTLEDLPVTTPSNVQVTTSPGSVTVEWEPSFSAAGVRDYTIGLHSTTFGVIGRRTAETTTTFDVPPGGDLSVTVVAHDKVGRRSAASEPVEFTLPPSPTWEPPAVPTNVQVIFDEQGRAVRAEWDATGGASPVFYDVHVDGSAIERAKDALSVAMYPDWTDCTRLPGQMMMLTVTATSWGFTSAHSEAIPICLG